MTRAAEVAKWVLEREFIRAGHTTNDWILAQYRFCNVRREDDRVTRWLKKNWRDPYQGHPNMVGAMLLARMVNWPPTLEGIRFPTVWEPERVIDHIHACADLGKAWSSAYIVSTCGQPMDKALYVVQTVSQVLGVPAYTPVAGETLQAVWTRLKCVNGLGAGFIAAQVVADLKYCDRNLMQAKDWWTWACSGPGSRRGLNRYNGLPPATSWGKEEYWLMALRKMISEVAPLVRPMMSRIHAQDWQNVMCEWDKYERTRLGEGKPRKTYRPETAYQV